MGEIPHGCATTPATRRLTQQRTESLQKPAKRFGINEKTVAKWRKRTTTQEAVRGPKPASAVLTPAEEAATVLFCQQTLLPLDDCLYVLQKAISRLSRSARYRCFQRYGHQPPAPKRSGYRRQQGEIQRLPAGLSAPGFCRSTNGRKQAVLVHRH